MEEKPMDELVKKAKKGDKEAFTELIMSLEKDLYRIAKARLQNDDDILDAFQETAINAFKSIKKLKNTEYFKTWLIKILINNCNSLYKERIKRKESLLEDVQEERYLIDSDIEAINNELNFSAIIKKLNYDERISLILYYSEGYTNKEIGKILKTNENTIKARISRAKTKIKKMLKDDMNVEYK